MSVTHPLEEFSALKDPLCGGKVEHRLIDTGRFEACFDDWARLFGATLGREIVPIDGGTGGGSFDRGRQQAAFMLSVHGQLIVDWFLARVRSAIN
jgi:hypothetical protein